MRNLVTIFKRELLAYYTSAIGYIFIIVFLILSVGLYITPFFTSLQADMRAFFSTLPIILCIFLPAITMRVWAEERKQNTWEMLLTFPMRPFELVLGKFFATLFFFLSALLGTFTIPLMLAALGNPDLGPIFGAYLGTIFLAAFFLALGLFISVLCRDQIVAFVVSLLACFALYLLGTSFITTYIDATWSGLGSLLDDAVGLTDHYMTFARGILALNDVIYFFIWTVVFLYLNGLYLEIRSRVASRNTFFATTVLCLAMATLSNWILADQRLARFDLTKNKIYTLSDASTRILRSLEAPAYVNLYITPHDKMPTEMRNLERDIIDKLDEMRLASDGKLMLRVIHMETTNLLQSAAAAVMDNQVGEKEDAVEKRLLDKGIRPFSVQALREDEVVNKLVYSAIGVAYKDNDEELIPRVVPADLLSLEYRLVHLLFKLNQEERPIVAFFAPKATVKMPPYMRQIYQQLGRPLPGSEDPFAPLERLLQHEKYDVRRIEFTHASPVPDDASTLVVLHPQDLSERQRWEINRFLYGGKSVFLGVQLYRWDYQVVRNAVSITKQDQHPQINPLIRHYGVEIDPSILMDVNHQSLMIRPSNNPLTDVFDSGITLNLPLHIVLPQEAMNRNVSITSHLSSLFYLWGSALKLQTKTLQKHRLKQTTLLSSSPQAWTVSNDTHLSTTNLQSPSAGSQARPLAVLIRGEFPDVYAGKERPAWSVDPTLPGTLARPTEALDEPHAKMPVAAPGKLLLIGNAQMFHRNFLRGGNLDFFINSIDALTLGDDIIGVRSKKGISRTINKPSMATRQLWKFVNLGLVNILIAAIGIGAALLRRRSRAAYSAKQL